MNTKRHLLFLFVLGVASWLALPAAAQEPNLDDYLGRLPENTLFCLSWKNVSQFDQLRATNPLLRLLDSPEMKANWRALREFQERQEKARQVQGKPAAEKKPAASEPNWNDVAALLANPGLIAMVMPPASSSSPAAKTPEPAFLFLYDSTGKEELLAKIDAQNQKPGEKRRSYDFGGINVTETLDPAGKPKSYEAQVGRWRVEGNNQAAFEEWVRAVQQAPARSLKDSAAYERSRTVQDPKAQIEAFFNLAAWSDLMQSVPAPRPGASSPGKLSEALGLNEWDLALLSVVIEPERVRYHLAALRSSAATDTPPILGPAVAEFPSLRFAPENALSYSVSEISLPGLWAYIHQATTSLVPPEQSKLVEGFQAMIETVLGMKMEELTSAWGTEFAQVSYPLAEAGKVHTLYLFSIRDRERVLTAVRNLSALAGPQMTIEETPGEGEQAGVTYFHVSRAATAEASQPQPLLHAAVTADWLLVGANQEEVEKAVKTAGPGRSLRDNSAFQQNRQRFPAELITFSYADADRWLESGAVATLLKEIAKSMVDSGRRQPATPAQEPQPSEGQTPEASAPSVPAPEPPELKIPRGYIKWILSATSRDASGIYLTGIIE